MLKWMKLCKVELAFAGSSLKNETYQLTQAVKKLETEDAMGTNIHLAYAQLETVNWARTLHNGLKTMTIETRDQLIKKQKADVEWPTQMQHRLLVAAIKDCLKDRSGHL